MDAKKIIYLLGLIHSETGRNGAELASLYQRALDEDDDIIELKSLKDDYSYFNQGGDLLYQSARGVLDEIYSNPHRALDYFPKLRQCTRNIFNNVMEDRDSLLGPRPLIGSIKVIKKSEIEIHKRVLEDIASTCVYLLLLYKGWDSVKNLNWIDEAGIHERLHAVNLVFLPALSKISKVEECWVIRKQKVKSPNFFGGDFFYIEYKEKRMMLEFFRSTKYQYIGSYSYINLYPDSSGDDQPYCWGIGNLLSFNPLQALSTFRNSMVTKLRTPTSEELSRPLPSTNKCLRVLTDGNNYCIGPEDLLRAMNQWQVAHETNARINSKRCLFCGGALDGNRVICSKHISPNNR